MAGAALRNAERRGNATAAPSADAGRSVVGSAVYTVPLLKESAGRLCTYCPQSPPPGAPTKPSTHSAHPERPTTGPLGGCGERWGERAAGRDGHDRGTDPGRSNLPGSVAATGERSSQEYPAQWPQRPQ